MNLRARQYAIVLGVLLLWCLVFPHTPLQSWWETRALRVSGVLDQEFLKLKETFSLATLIGKQQQIQNHVRTLEQENRTLQSEMAKLLLETADLRQSSSPSAFRSVTNAFRTVRFSKDAGGWFVINSDSAFISKGSPVYVDGVYVGRTITEGQKHASILLIQDGGLSISLRHEKSGKVGRLIRSKGELLVEFFEVIPQVLEGELLTVVPDQEGTPAFFPVGTVKALRTSPSDPTTRVLITLLADVEVGILGALGEPQ